MKLKIANSISIIAITSIIETLLICDIATGTGEITGYYYFYNNKKDFF